MSVAVSRAGEKLEFALDQFKINVKDLICADFGSNVGGFVDVLLKRGAQKVYSVETGYGVLDWNLRNNPQIVVYEKTNAMHVTLPERVDFASVDVSWTPQLKVLPNVINNLKVGGQIISLIKPHYEASHRYIKLHKGKLDDDLAIEVVNRVATEITTLGLLVLDQIKSPIVGGKAGNVEYLLRLKRPQ